MRAATLHFLQQGASSRGSSETYVFSGATQVGRFVHATYQGSLPAFYLYSHSKVVVAYDPDTRTVAFLRRE